MNHDKPKQPDADQSTPAAPKPDATEVDKRKPEELTEEDLRLMADTMPGDGPGDD